MQIREELRMRVAFVTFAAIPVAIVCFHFMVRQVLEPWGMKHHALFAGKLLSASRRKSKDACQSQHVECHSAGQRFKHLLVLSSPVVQPHAECALNRSMVA